MASSLRFEIINRNRLVRLEQRFVNLERNLVILSQRLELLVNKMEKKVNPPPEPDGEEVPFVGKYSIFKYGERQFFCKNITCFFCLLIDPDNMEAEDEL
jgi:hypothetical protein